MLIFALQQHLQNSVGDQVSIELVLYVYMRTQKRHLIAFQQINCYIPHARPEAPDTTCLMPRQFQHQL